MEKFQIFHIQYKRKKNKINTFYAIPRPPGETLDSYEISNQIDLAVRIYNLAKPKDNHSLEEIAQIVEKEVLVDHNFVKIKGIKANRPSYKKMILETYAFEIK